MSERYLLFDGGCSVCAALAREVETLSGGRLGVRSLREPEVQALLDRARPGWRWEPMLVEIEGERVRVLAGLALRARLVQILGPVRTWRVAQAVARMGGPVLGVDWGRRRLLRQSLALAGLALLRRIPGGTHAPRTTGSAGSASPRLGPGEGELWEGFVLLPEGAPIPPFVRQVPTPILCQTDGSPEAEALRGETLTFTEPERLRSLIRFPLYVPSRLPPGIVWQGAAVTRFARSGEVFSVSLNFGDGEGVPRLRVIAQPMYPSPYPVWPVYAPDRPEEPIFPEKVFFTPRPGLLLPSAWGHLMVWLEEDVLHVLIAEHDSQLEAAIIIAKSLHKIH
jgi:predicted DCC family thiol-disulfide oxidoreductase YuxK